MKIVDRLLSDGEYYKVVTKKDTVYLHHTAGGHRPDWSIDGWEKDRTKSGSRLPVATSYVIGGKSITDGDTSFDGIIYRAFDDKYWAHHLGTSLRNNQKLNEKSIGIEICNYGPLTKNRDGVFLNYVNKAVPSDCVITLKKPHRGFTYYHAYTDAQLVALKELLIDISTRHNIDLKKGLKILSNANDMFELQNDAINGYPGVWSHTSVRKDKFDVFPQPQLIELLKNL